jgi:hypothetical protein
MKPFMHVSATVAKLASVTLLLCGACSQAGVAVSGIVPGESTVDVATTLEAPSALVRIDGPTEISPANAMILGPASEGVSLHASTPHPAS